MTSRKPDAPSADPLDAAALAAALVGPNDQRVTRLCQELELAMRKFGHITTAHYEQGPREVLAAAIAEREREIARLREQLRFLRGFFRNSRRETRFRAAVDAILGESASQGTGETG